MTKLELYCPMFIEDLKWMKIALRLADRNTGNVHPNPAVGCLIINNGRIVGRGWTQAGGRPHAEIMALEQAGNLAAGATVYTTLEPCSHYGHTPPCCDALIAAGINRLVGSMKDPDTRVNGTGFLKLRDAGVEVIEGVEEKAAINLNKGFVSKIKSGLPLITLKLALSIDSQIATSAGESKWITGTAARSAGHLLRSRHDAILTGIGTVCADNPILNCRINGLEERSPVRIVLDTKLQIPMMSNLVATAPKYKTIIFTTKAAVDTKKVELKKLGLDIISVDTDNNGRVSLMVVLQTLVKLGITRVLVECGSMLASEFIRLNLVDRLVVHRAPIVIGGDGKPSINSIGVAKLDMAISFGRPQIEQVENDIIETYQRRV
jgi:diaminohydroxyphosphoribosylaminopyrimidine deaminase/5-amino-6-(5-phosphoribosylamino)uracil reductase